MVDGWITADTLVHEKALARVLDGSENLAAIYRRGEERISCVMIDLNYGREDFL
jgi:hypothetical protein